MQNNNIILFIKNVIEWWLLDSGLSIVFFSQVHLDLVNSRFTTCQTILLECSEMFKGQE